MLGYDDLPAVAVLCALSRFCQRSRLYPPPPRRSNSECLLQDSCRIAKACFCGCQAMPDSLERVLHQSTTSPGLNRLASSWLCHVESSRVEADPTIPPESPVGSVGLHTTLLHVILVPQRRAQPPLPSVATDCREHVISYPCPPYGVCLLSAGSAGFQATTTPPLCQSATTMAPLAMPRPSHLPRNSTEDPETATQYHAFGTDYHPVR